MNLNKLNNIFSRKSLSREDIDHYGKTKDLHERNIVEQKALNSDFNSDAMEGWEMMDYKVSSMNRLDKKFMPRTKTPFYLITSVVVIGVILSGIYIFTKPYVDDLPEKDRLVQQTPVSFDLKLDETDIIIPEEIEKMEEADQQQTVRPEIIKSDFVVIDSVQKLEPIKEVPTMPIIHLDVTNKKDRDIIMAHERATEVYLHDFKLIDYGQYRNAPEVKTRQIILTGLPANKETEFSEELNSEWQDVDVPYMEYIDKSMEVFGKARYKKALSRFETILETYPQDINANFYAGICLYNLKEYRTAIEYFNKCRRGAYSNFDQEAQWMIALCYTKLHDPKARKLFEEIIEKGGYYATQAEEKLKNI